MKRLVIQTILSGVIFISCTDRKRTDSQQEPIVESVTQKTTHMENLISIIEIPTKDFARAVKFYQTILNLRVEEMEMADIKMGLFPNAEAGVAVQLIHGSDYMPSPHGTLVYLNGGEDLQQILDKIESNGGSVVVPKTEIGPDMGFFALFMDTEGNKLGLHSYK